MLIVEYVKLYPPTIPSIPLINKSALGFWGGLEEEF